MPQPRKYASQALRQAAYRQRSRTTQENRLSQRGLPTGPAIPSMPGTARWTSALKQARGLIQMVSAEMRDYYDNRSQQWQETAQADAFLERQDAIQEVLDQIEAVSG